MATTAPPRRPRSTSPLSAASSRARRSDDMPTLSGVARGSGSSAWAAAVESAARTAAVAILSMALPPWGRLSTADATTFTPPAAARNTAGSGGAPRLLEPRDHLLRQAAGAGDRDGVAALPVGNRRVGAGLDQERESLQALQARGVEQRRLAVSDEVQARVCGEERAEEGRVVAPHGGPQAGAGIGAAG